MSCRRTATPPYLYCLPLQRPTQWVAGFMGPKASKRCEASPVSAASLPQSMMHGPPRSYGSALRL